MGTVEAPFIGCYVLYTVIVQSQKIKCMQRLCVCLCTGITLWGPDVATSIIPVNSNLMGIFLGPHDETSL